MTITTPWPKISARPVIGLVLVFGMFEVILGSTIPSGLYALYESHWGIDRSQTTIIFACYVVGVVSSLIFLGGVADRIGRKPALGLSVLLCLISSALFLGAVSPIMLYAARLFSGLAVGVATGAFTAALCDTLGKGTGALLSTVVTSAALASGPLASAIVAEFLPHPLHIPFGIHLVLLAVALLGVLLIPETYAPQGRHPGEAQLAQGAHNLFVSRWAMVAFIVCASIIGWAYAANGMFQSVVPLAIDGSADSQLQMALLTSLMLGLSAITQIATYRLSPHTIIGAGLILLAAGLALSSCAVLVQHGTLLWCATSVVGVGQGMSFRASLTFATNTADPKRQATVISGYYIVGYLGTAVAPLISNITGVAPVLAAMALLCIVSVLFVRALHHRDVLTA